MRTKAYNKAVDEGRVQPGLGEVDERDEPLEYKRLPFMLVVVDDMGYNDVGYNNVDGDIFTPTLDALAAGGVTLTHHYSQFSCTPSRAALLTGLLPINTGMFHESISQTAGWGLPSGFRRGWRRASGAPSHRSPHATPGSPPAGEA